MHTNVAKFGLKLIDTTDSFKVQISVNYAAIRPDRVLSMTILDGGKGYDQTLQRVITTLMR